MVVGELKELAELLEKTRWGKDFDWKELMALSGYMRLDRHRAGAVVGKEGDQDHSLMIIGKGAVQVFKMDSTLKPKLLTQLGTGQTVGEISLVDGQPRSATMVAVDDVETLVLTRPQFDKLCDENPRLGIKVAMRLARLMSARLRATTGALSEQIS
jgi:CRP-like cAMP-binding protein